MKFKLSQLKVNPGNPRLIKDEKFKRLCKSIQDFPEMMPLRPIIYDENNIILGGNMRYKALQELGMKEIPADWVKCVTELSEEKKKEFVIKDNNSFGEYDFDMLANEWDSLPLTDWGVDLPDFMTDTEVKEDEFEIPDEIETDIVTGDLFQIGQHRLMCGDSTKAEVVSNLMNGEKADMVFTDPPYGVSIGNKNKMLNSFQRFGRNLNNIHNDSLSADQLKIQLLPTFINIKQNMADDCTVFVTAPQRGDLGMMMMMMMAESGLKVRHVLIWKKNSPTFSMGRLDYDYQHEPILLTWDKRHKFYGKGKYKTSVWEIDKPRKSKEHPTMKPVELVANALLNNSIDGNIVIDLFLGSGTTMVAAHQLNRKCYGMEIDPKYCQIIIDRMKAFDPQIEIKKLNESS